MANRTRDRALLVLVLGAAIGLACSSGGIKSSDGGTPGLLPEGGTDLGVDADPDPDPQNFVACRVALDDALNPCAPTGVEQEMRYRGTDFGVPNGCFAGIIYQTIQPNHTWECAYVGGVLVGWDRIEGTQLCDGRASAVVGDAWSMGQLMSCLSVDRGWTWILGFDPGPTRISVQLATATTGSTARLSVGVGFTLSGGEVAGSDLTLRYWYTADARGGAAPPQSISCDGANGLSCDFTTISLVPVTPPRPLADTYAEVSFPMLGTLSTGFAFELDFSMSRTDGALYDQSNDHSYNGATQATPTTKVTAYVKGALIYGSEP